MTENTVNGFVTKEVDTNTITSNENKIEPYIPNIIIGKTYNLVVCKIVSYCYDERKIEGIYEKERNNYMQ